MKQDRFLLIILGGIGILIIAALSLFFIRQQPQEYRSEDTPDGVVHNYVLSLQLGDYQRAYNYLQNASDKPDFNTFQQSLLRNENEFSRAAVQLGELNIFEKDARVDVTIIHTNNDPFARSWAEKTPALLTLQDNEWHIVSMPFPYWGWDWYIKD